MPRLDLTDRFCATIKTKKLIDYFDARTTGLGLRVSPTGVKAWSVMFTIPGTQSGPAKPRHLSRHVPRHRPHESHRGER